MRPSSRPVLRAISHTGASASARTRRQDVRYPFRIAGAIESARAHDPVVTRDVSFMSMYLEVPRCPPLRHLVRLAMIVPDTGEKLVVHGWVVRVVQPDPDLGRPAGMVVSLFGLDRDARRIWWDLVARVRDGAVVGGPGGDDPASGLRLVAEAQRA